MTVWLQRTHKRAAELEAHEDGRSMLDVLVKLLEPHLKELQKKHRAKLRREGHDA